MTLRPELPPLPERIKRLPIDERGYPVPWFVAIIDGKPDHRIVEAGKILTARQHRLCWICGESLEIDISFVVGPMCVVNRVTSEPPSHPECAIFSVKACPFLSRPHAKRRENNLPENQQEPAGEALWHNPGASAVYTCQSYRVRNVGNGVLFSLNPPTQPVQWFTEGRPATRAEVEAAQQIGLPKIMAMAVEDGPKDVALLNKMIEASKKHLPKE